MKNSTIFSRRGFNVIGSVVGLALLFAAISCNKDGSSSNTYFEFKVNGDQYKASGLLAYATEFSSDFTIYGIQDQNSKEVCFINLPKGIAAGTYALNDADHSGYYIGADDTTYSTFWGASSGSVTLEEIDAAHVKGTFQFTVFDSGTETIKKTLTEGKFNVNFR